MSFLAPAFFYASLAVAAGVVALHLIVTRQPPSSPLPTAQFVPEGAVETVTVTRRPEDLLLLLLRVLLIVLAGAAFARPVLDVGRRPMARVILADLSSATANRVEVADSVRALYTEGDLLVAFDSAARVVSPDELDSLASGARAGREGRFSTALVAALRGAAELQSRADSLELVIVSPFAAEEYDAATGTVRALWPGRATLVKVAARSDSASARAGFTVRGAEGDPLLATASLLGAGDGAAVRVVRGPVTPADSVWATEAGRTLVRWPAEGAPPGWMPREPVDTVGAVTSSGATVVAPFERRWALDRAPAGTQVIGRWVDGVPAAVERRIGDGCIRDVAVPVPARGDLVLRPSFVRLLDALTRPCRALAPVTLLSAARIDSLAGTGTLTSAAEIAPLETLVTPLVPWLIAAALIIALVELVLRRRRRLEAA